MSIIAIDLGTTNIKVASYTENLQFIALENHAVSYLNENGFIEFEAEDYFNNVVNLIKACYARSVHKLGDKKVQLVLTGQAESLIIIDQNGKSVRNGISWLDTRSKKECEQLSAQFSKEECYQITGQPEIIPTWPLTKICWLKNNEPQTLRKNNKLLMLKDYIAFCLTGELVGEYSIYPFSHYFDIRKKTYWEAPLNYCGISVDQLPKLVEPCSIIGNVQLKIIKETALPNNSFVNIGTLDHFAGMIGTGNIAEGLVSESAGTVSSIATFTSVAFTNHAKIPLYCAPFKDRYIYLPVCESGGISLEWFKNNFIPHRSFKEIDDICLNRYQNNLNTEKPLTFLPYLTGVNPPEFDANACGVFYGISLKHDQYDFALAIMSGVALLLKKNIDFFKLSNIKVEKIISTGGGAKSALWSQIKADICNVPVVIPKNQEAPCLGAAIIGAVSSGFFVSYATAIANAVQMERIYYPNANRDLFEQQFALFNKVYDSSLNIANYQEIRQ